MRISRFGLSQNPHPECCENAGIASIYRTDSGLGNMQTLVVQAQGKFLQPKVVAMLDSGSDTTCIDDAFAKQLGCEQLTQPKTVTVKYLDREITLTSTLVRFIIESPSGEECMVIEAWTVPNLSDDTNAIDWSVEKLKFDHLKDLKIEPLPDDNSIKLLIGNRLSDCFIPEDIRKGSEPNQPFGYKTMFGWTILGSNDQIYQRLNKESTNYHSLFSKTVRLLNDYCHSYNYDSE